jgi:CelD/BcsL family acetyltransferase involved in cellulose biosynthesis
VHELNALRPVTAAPAGPPTPVVLDSVLAVEAARSELEAVAWTRLDPVPDYFLAVIASRREVLRPHVVRLPGAEGGEMVLAARLEEIPLSVSVGYRTVYRPRVRALTLVHGGVSGLESDLDADLLLHTVRASLPAAHADVLSLPALRVGSAFHTAAMAAPSALRSRFRHRSTHWTLRLPDSFDEFLRSRSKKTRENVRVYGNRLNRDHGDGLSLRVFREPGELERLMAEVETVAATTYQRGLGVAPADTEEDRALTELSLNRGWFRAWVLSLDGRPIAFWSGSAFDRTFFVGTPGYDPAFADYSIGTYLLMRVIEELCADDEIDVLDYGFGESDYKRRFGSDSWEEEDVLIFAPSFRGVRINATRTAVAGAAQLTRAVAAKTGLAPWLKRRWRRRLTARTDS